MKGFGEIAVIHGIDAYFVQTSVKTFYFVQVIT
jgi:hypothetical protein